ncbi:VOC family protein [Nocardiopsis sp. FIRDI 009]|uniref:VOC family protein n=1 Tax=Nocardiopsis sp. FIRDI 009 TaxID=714197 RepID=UPI000E24277B|nr:VOC family protein [Nocardiopsis sp. FIRDI 009]
MSPSAPGLPTARAVDHFAFTVPDLDAAVDYFTAALGAAECYREGPVHDPSGDRMARRLGVHPRASARIALLRLGGSNLELFDYTSPETSPPRPALHSAGAFYLALAVDEPAATARRLRARADTGSVPIPVPRVASAGAEREWVRTPWGQPLALCVPGEAGRGRPAADAPTAEGVYGVEHVGFTVTDLDAVTDFHTSVLGAVPLNGPEPVGLGSAHGLRTVLRLGPTFNAELYAYPGAGRSCPPPRNSDLGGHHLAVYVDDVDEAARYLRGHDGVEVMGDPETITDGPLVGDRWVYFRTPFGAQMEAVHMPDGRLPYERGATALRVPQAHQRWDAPV